MTLICFVGVITLKDRSVLMTCVTVQKSGSVYPEDPYTNIYFNSRIETKFSRAGNQYPYYSHIDLQTVR